MVIVGLATLSTFLCAGAAAISNSDITKISCAFTICFDFFNYYLYWPTVQNYITNGYQ